MDWIHVNSRLELTLHIIQLEQVLNRTDSWSRRSVEHTWLTFQRPIECNVWLRFLGEDLHCFFMFFFVQSCSLLSSKLLNTYSNTAFTYIYTRELWTIVPIVSFPPQRLTIPCSQNICLFSCGSIYFESPVMGESPALRLAEIAVASLNRRFRRFPSIQRLWVEPRIQEPRDKPWSRIGIHRIVRIVHSPDWIRLNQIKMLGNSHRMNCNTASGNEYQHQTELDITYGFWMSQFATDIPLAFGTLP